MAHAIQMRLDLQVESESIHGTACDQEGRTSSFAGWLGLIAIVEQAQAELGGGHVRSAESMVLPPWSRARANEQDLQSPEAHRDDRRSS